MCGIAGAVGFIDRRIADAVRAADAAQRHRGPDGQGWWQSPATDDGLGAALAHRRLAILDLSAAGAQPMHDPSTGCVIAFNGEVFNYQAIRDELRPLGHAFTSDCDTEVILKAYVQWGPSCVERFRGMFAYAIWDPRARQLHIARDRLGIKPLYYTAVEHAGGGTSLVFASEMRSLLESGLVERKLDPVGLASYLWNGFVPGPNTLVRGIELLPPGTRVTIDAGRAMPTPERYWSVPKAAKRKATVEDVRRELREAVRLRLISDVPLGVFLSGGIDSSAVAALAVDARGGDGGQVHTFTIGFGESEYDESGYAQRVADQLGTRHRLIPLTEDAFKSQLDAALDSIDQPTFDAINTYFVSRAVREAGVTVALAGTGGDELFGGYRSFVDVPAAARWSRRLGWMPRPVAKAVAAAKGGGSSGGMPAQTRWGKLPDVLATRGDTLGLYQVSYALFTSEFLAELRAGANGHGHSNGNGTVYGLPPGRAAELDALIAGDPDLHAVSMLELSMFIGERLLRDTDAASMAVALEARVPLLDHEVVEAVAGLDADTRFSPPRSKRLLRELALSRLDPAIFDRPKSGFVLPIETWCRQGLRDRVADTFRDEGLCRQAGLNPGAVARLWAAFEAGSTGLYWSRIWSIFVLLWWCRRYGVSA